MNIATALPLPPSLAALQFVNHFTRELPADPETENHRRQVREACYSRVSPTPVREPELLAVSSDMLERLGISETDSRDPAFAAVFAGNQLLPGMDPHAMCYGGHQFGNWAGQLGDGRAINLGDVKTPDGETLTLQLKGAGPTPYSRTADGRAVLRSSVREFLCSEAMHGLGIPTTRALSLVATGEAVMRDMFYDGHAAYEPGAVVCRVSPSFIRPGNFQIFAARKDSVRLKQLTDFTIRRYYSHLEGEGEALYTAWFREICDRTAELMVHWMRVGFVHGVMNTDNLSILGETIDYGPYGWLEDYDPDWTPNTTDAEGRRYRFGNQPVVAHWNLYQLANALVPLFSDHSLLEQQLEHYAEVYNAGSRKMLNAKLGLNTVRDGDEELTNSLLTLMQRTETDMTLLYRGLAKLDITDDPFASNESPRMPQSLMPAFYRPDEVSPDLTTEWSQWWSSYQSRAEKESLANPSRRHRMNQTNPKFVLRNYIAQEAIDLALKGDHSRIQLLLEVFSRPYDEQPEYEQFAAPRPEWARSRPGCSMLSCSS